MTLLASVFGPARISVRRRSVRWLSIVFAIAAGLAVWPRHTGFIPLVPQPLPQQVTVDFNGDGRSDFALIRTTPDSSYVTIGLTGSNDGVILNTRVVGLTALDIDHDGDIDLVAVTPSGQLIIWLNDGRGRFVPQEASHTDRMSATTTFRDTMAGGTIAFGTVAPLVAAQSRHYNAQASAQIRRSVPTDFDVTATSLPSLRGPPSAARPT
jgi:VCBS repeat protein